MTCRVLLFARLRDLAGAAEVTLTLPDGARVADLRRRLAADCPALAGLLPACAAAVNDRYAADDTVLPANAEVALLPPVSGGQPAPREAPWSA